jgi:very-short-patch-repair endonuclease
MSYGNQGDHKLLDRQLIRELLLCLADSRVSASPAHQPRGEHIAELTRLADSELERSWLRFLEQQNLRLPGKAQQLIEDCSTRPDFLYDDSLTAIYVDGPAHSFADRQERDRLQTECMEDRGYTVIRFGHQDDWSQIVNRYAHVFGRVS